MSNRPYADRSQLLHSHCCAMSRVTRQSSILSLEASNNDDSDNSDDDVSMADVLARLAKEKNESDKDVGFFTDGDGNNEDSTDDYSDPGDATTVAENKEEARASAS